MESAARMPSYPIRIALSDGTVLGIARTPEEALALLREPFDDGQREFLVGEVESDA